MKKFQARAAVALSAALIIAACGGGSSSDNTQSSNASSSQASSIDSTSSSSVDSTSSSSSGNASSSTGSISGGTAFVDEQVGFSTQNGGTSGGAGGAVVTVTTGTELNAALCNRASKTTPIIILVNGTINHGNTTKQTGQCDTQPDLIDLKGVENISIIGVGSNAVFDQLGIHIRSARNIIIRNVHVKNVKKSGSPTSNGGDAISMESDVSNVWVDHVTLEASGGEKQGYDGLFDMKDGTKYVTLSWSILMNSERGGLVGSSDSDNTNGPVTFHHNFYSNLNSRMPLLRHATAHSYNNYFDGVVESGMNPRIGGKIKAENNYFTNAKNPIGTFYTTDMGYWEVSGNIFTDTVTWVPNATNKEYPAGPNPVSTTTIAIPYAYVLDNAADIPTIVKNGAGAGKMPTSLLPGGGGSSSSDSSSSTSSSDTSSSSSSSSGSVDAGPTPVCTGVFACDSGVGAQVMNASVTAATSQSVDASGLYTITGAGKMDNSNSYNFYFKHMPLTGNFVMTARMLSQAGTTTDSGARAGLIAVESLSASPVFAWTARYNDAAGQIRAAINGNAKAAISGFSSSTLPVWVRIERRNNALYSAASTDGVTWKEVTNTSVSAATIYAGFAVSSGANGTAATATFDSLTVTGGGL